MQAPLLTVSLLVAAACGQEAQPCQRVTIGKLQPALGLAAAKAGLPVHSCALLPRRHRRAAGWLPCCAPAGISQHMGTCVYQGGGQQQPMWDAQLYSCLRWLGQC